MLRRLHSKSPNADAAMRAMFAARKKVFVDLLRWDLPVLAGRYELDQFDNEDARYLILSETTGAHLASARLLPTTRPHLLDSHFAALSDAPIPHGRGVYEITRFCLDRGLNAAQRREARDQLIRGLVDHALENDIKTYTGVAEPAWLDQILNFGWQARPLGRTKEVDGMMLGALRIGIGPDTHELLDRAGIIKRPDYRRAEAA
jgi:N-acyl-L-homoserine lactone synthetase